MSPAMLEKLEARRLFNGLPAMSIGDVSVVEGNAGTKTAAVVVSLFQPRPHPTVTVSYATQNGTAVAGSDYVATSGSLTFGPNESSKTILIPVIGDTAAEPDEYFAVNLQGAKGAKVADGQALVSIVDDEPTLSISSASGDEGNAGTTSMLFTVNLSGASTQTVTATFNTADGSAVAGADYQATSGTVTFAPGDTSKTIAVPVIGDRIGETDKYFVVNLVGASKANIAGSQAYGTILDDEPRISVTGASALEGASGSSTDFVFTVSLSRPYDQEVTVNFATQDYSAFAGVDYLGNSGTLTFAPGDTSRTVTVKVFGNDAAEPEKDFLVTLSDASANALPSNGQAYGSIVDDDGYVYEYYDYGYYDYGYYDYYYYW